VRKAALLFGIFIAVIHAGEKPMLGDGFDGIRWNAPQNPVFYDKQLLVRQYGFGMIGGVVAGALCFYIGNAFEGAIFDTDSKKGYLSFTGVRYEHLRGPFWGGGTGVLFGSALTVFFIGDSDEEQGGFWLTLLGGALTSAAAFGLADQMGVQEERSWSYMVPLVALPPLGSIAGYHVSRWMNDRKRRKITEVGSAGWQPPRLAVSPEPGGLALRMDALHFTF
jgi:hypothetical protein